MPPKDKVQVKVSKNPRIWLLIVLTVAIFTRAGLWLTYPLAQGNDTATYLHLANSLKNNAGFDRYNGTRTPGYPFFIMVAGNNQNVYLFQLGLGLLSTLLIFFISWRLSHKAWFAGMMALTHTLNLGQLFFEAAYLSEALATFFLFLILACLVILFNRQNTRPETQAERISAPVILLISLIIGLTAAALAMTRPLFAFVPFLGVVFMLVFWRNIPFHTRLFASILTALPAFLILLLWINFIYTRFNVLGMDSIGGYHLVNHTSSFFELAPAEFAPVRDTFLKFRAEQIKTSGSPVNTIWDAIPSLMAQTKLNYYSLGRLMGTISTRLIHEHPWLYLQNLALGWCWFWRVGVFWMPDSLVNSTFQKVLSWLMFVERAGLFGINLLFIVGSLLVVWKKLRSILQHRFKKHNNHAGENLDTVENAWADTCPAAVCAKRVGVEPTPSIGEPSMNLYLWFILSAVWVTSVLQTLAEHGDNARFLAPMQTLVVLITACWMISWKKQKSELSKDEE